ncbi:hypothetical protein GHT06_015985 [Daphnia sinensis]|uniref:Uncharacterized protein n=1 Tax=Daphnia sinensis TaxID=1820382 RepID=A0AAD5LAM2_9CRUS|nr:hypothetical protein GHT06_015985 [Daphnia sinensis]
MVIRLFMTASRAASISLGENSSAVMSGSSVMSFLASSVCSSMARLYFIPPSIFGYSSFFSPYLTGASYLGGAGASYFGGAGVSYFGGVGVVGAGVSYFGRAEVVGAGVSYLGGAGVSYFIGAGYFGGAGVAPPYMVGSASDALSVANPHRTAKRKFTCHVSLFNKVSLMMAHCCVFAGGSTLRRNKCLRVTSWSTGCAMGLFQNNNTDRYVLIPFSQKIKTDLFGTYVNTNQP